MFTVVEEEHCPSSAEPVDDRVDVSYAVLERDRQGRSNRTEDRVRIRYRSQFDHPYSVVELIKTRPAKFDREARLADPTRSGQRDEAVIPNQALGRAELISAVDQRRRRHGKRPRSASHRISLVIRSPNPGAAEGRVMLQHAPLQVL